MPSRLDAAYAARVKAVRARVTEFSLARFHAGEFRDADLAKFVDSVVPVALAGRRQISGLTDAWLAQKLTKTLGHPVRPRGPINTDQLRGVPAAEVYARPFVTVRTKLSEGRPFDAAVSAGAARLVDITASDMQLAKTHTAQRTLSDTDGISGYMRTLGGAADCGLCVVASTQFYHVADLLPIHPGCDCGVDPIASGDRVVLDDRLKGAHAAVEERFGVSDPGARAPDYRKLLLVEEHGELGPVLTVKSHRFTSESDLPRT